MDLKGILKSSIAKNDKYLQNKMNSPQFDLSMKIIELENNTPFDQENIAKKLDIPFDYLLDLEAGNTDISINDYNINIEKLKLLITENNDIKELKQK